jgi:hypothetical protein
LAGIVGRKSRDWTKAVRDRNDPTIADAKDCERG